MKSQGVLYIISADKEEGEAAEKATAGARIGDSNPPLYRIFGRTLDKRAIDAYQQMTCRMPGCKRRF